MSCGWQGMAGGALVCVLTVAASAGVIDAGPPTDLSVTVYRAPYERGESLNLDELQGFALITERRSISIPAGDSIVRFPGVADGIRADTAVLAGVPGQLLEMDRDAHVLNPLELIRAAVGRTVTLVRTNPKTGNVTRTPATIQSGDRGAVVFETAQGVEALHCTGVAERFSFSGITDLGATPTLSVHVRTATAVTTMATLSYLSDGFDWQASYVAMLSADAGTMSLGGWVTLANSNAAGFPAAHTQVIAGSLNRVAESELQQDQEQPVAECWPDETTSDLPPAPAQPEAQPSDRGYEEVMVTARKAAVPSALASAVTVQQEQLGDLKLYRVPQTTDVASRQMKQVRLLDREGIRVQTYYRADLDANTQTSPSATRKMLRSRNDEAHHLGLPLPSGRIVVNSIRNGEPLLLSEAPMRDVARDEMLEVDLGNSADVQTRAEHRRTQVDERRVRDFPLLPGVIHLRSAVVDDASSIEISNARPSAAELEIHLHMPDGMQLIAAQPAPASAGAQPLFRLSVPANGRVIVRYQTEHTSDSLRRP